MPDISISQDQLNERTRVSADVLARTEALEGRAQALLPEAQAYLSLMDQICRAEFRPGHGDVG